MYSGNDKNNRARKVNPKLGLFGFLGFLGFAGIWTYTIQGDVSPFYFFCFFGFFGFFFEGKMSNVLMDERFKENRIKAQLQAYRIGLSVSFIVLIASTWDWMLQSNDAKLLFMVISLSLIIGLVPFLAEYLLYRYDSKDSGEE